MKKGVLYLGIVIMFFGCASGKYDYRDLKKRDMICEKKLFPYNLNQPCPSGEFDHFTIKKLTDFGERPSWSPDGKKVAFLDKEYGNVYEKDLDTNDTKCLTCDYEHNGFFRVHYMKDGDYLFLGPREKASKFKSRFFYNGFFWMPKDQSSPPRWIGEEHFEGVAVSRESRKIAYAKTWADSLYKFPSRMYVAEVTKEGNIVNQKVVHESLHVIEAQDFLPGDNGLIFSLYAINKEVYGIDFESGEVTNYSNCRSYEEPEGIFPDGRFTLVECNRHSKTPYLDALKSLAVPSLDIYMLRLDGPGKDIRRLTYFSDVPGEKANNPVVSPEGCRIVFMKAKSTGEWFRFQGEGKGLYLLEFYTCEHKEE